MKLARHSGIVASIALALSAVATASADESACFDWTPGQAPSGWFSAWSGEAGGAAKNVVGPDGAKATIYVTYADGNANNQKWIPYRSSCTALTNYTFITYGSADMVKADDGKLAILWCMGGRKTEKTALVKDDAGHIKLVQFPAQNDDSVLSPTKTIDAGTAKGYHLFTVRFSQDYGASLQIDDGDIYRDTTFTQVSGAGIQLGSVLSGSRDPLAREPGFAILKMLAYPTAELSETQCASLRAQYPASTTMNSQTLDLGNSAKLYLPSLTLSSGSLRIQSGVLEIPAGTEASLSALEFGDKKGSPLFGMNLAGKLEINTSSTGTTNDFTTAYADCNNGRGVDLGEWTGIGTNNVTGTFSATNTIATLCHDATSVTLNVNGGTFSVKGVTSRHNGRADIVLFGGGLVNYGEYASCAATIGKTYGLGTVTGTKSWTDTDSIALVGEGEGTTFLADGIDLRFSGSVTGAGNATVSAPNGGSVEFAAFEGTGRLTVASGTLRLPNNAPLPCELEVAAGATLDILTDETEAYVSLSAAAVALAEGALVTVNGATLSSDYAVDCTQSAVSVVPVPAAENMATECVLRISEVMPKPTDDRNPGLREGMDVNGLESGWVELENTSDKWADIKDYRFISVKRGKKTDPLGEGNFPSRLVAPHSRTVFYTSERYPNSDEPAESAFEQGTFDAKPRIYPDLGNILVWGKKVNPKKFPYVRLYYAPGGDEDAGTVVDTVVVPSDVPEGYSIIVGNAAEGEGTRRWLCPAPTRGRPNSDTDALVRLGPNVGPLYEKKGQKKTDVASEFADPVPPATPGADYSITMPINPVMNPNGTFTPRAADAIASIKLVFRTDLDDSTLATNDVDMATKTTDSNKGDLYTASIPATAFPVPGHLIQWKFLITDGEGTEWTSPSFNNPDDGYEWYGTIVEPTSGLMSASLPTWHMFASGAHLAQMDLDKDKQDLSKVPNYARIAIYDSSTSNYYDYVRIDLRGNTSAKFTKKGHGLRFAKAHPLTMTDVVTGQPIEEIRKTSLISEFADPSMMRQMTGFWLWRKMGNLVPFDFPVRCNLNGEFYQLAFNSERFTDELIEDVYGLDKFGYGYKNVGTLKSGSSTTAGSIEKKTPDDEDESNITVLEDALRSKITAAQSVSSSPNADDTGLDNAALTKFVVQKFNLPAWINYLASARITQEMDDVWANACAYYDNAELKEGVRGTDTWMPLGYDFNISFGQWYYNDLKSYGATRSGLSSTNDWFKSHPFYGGNRVRAYRKADFSGVLNGNDGFESVLQSAKFRRLFLRRLRTLMDQELKEPGTAEADVPFMAKMRELADLMRADAALDQAKWPNDTSDDAIDVWDSATRPADIDAGIDDIWNNYVVPRRSHLYVTHSVTNSAMTIGYGSNLNAGIPLAQSPVETLAPNIFVSNMTTLDAETAAALEVDSQFYDTDVIAIRNDNSEAVDMSGWRLAFSVDFTFPAGTVCDAGDCIYIVADRRAYVAEHESELADQVIVGNATFTGAGPIALYAADGTLVFGKVPNTNERKYLRLHSFCGNTAGGGDSGEWFTLTNISDSVTLDLAGVTVCFLKQGDDDDATSHCHVTLKNKKGKGDVKPLASWTANQADYSGAGWDKIQNNKQGITIWDKYGTVCQFLQVAQKDFPLAYGLGGYLVCDSTASSVTAKSDWHAVYDLANGSQGESFTAKSQAKADEMLVGATPTLTEDDVAAGLETQYLKVVAEPVEGVEGSYKAVVAVNPATVAAPILDTAPAAEEKPMKVEDDTDGKKKVSVRISNAVLGLWYGYEVSDTPTGEYQHDAPSFKRATGSSTTIEGSPRAQPSGFFRVKVLPTNPAD